MTYIPGYMATVLLDAEDIGVVGSVVSLNLSRNIQTKPVFGSAYAGSLAGQRSGQFSANGHITAEKIVALTGLFENDAPVTFSIQVGEAAGATDSGVYAGTCNVSNYTISGNADGEWDWSIQAATDGAVTYTAATP